MHGNQSSIFILSLTETLTVCKAGKMLEREWGTEQQVFQLSYSLEQATKVNPHENSFLPTSMTALSRVSPWDL